MVWIHGGAFKAGSISNNLYGPEFLFHEHIVLVKIQYPLNVLGFLSLTDDEVGVSGNAGLKDQVMALKWVQEILKILVEIQIEIQYLGKVLEVLQHIY